MSEKVVYLDAMTYGSMGIGGGHYYASLIGEIDGVRKDESLRFRLTQAQATEMNKEERRSGQEHMYTYRNGFNSSRFFSLDDAIENGRKVWKEHFPDAELLILGRPASAEPQEILVGPKEWKAKVNAWVTFGERISWHDSRDWSTVCDTFWSEMIERGYV